MLDFCTRLEHFFKVRHRVEAATFRVEIQLETRTWPGDDPVRRSSRMWGIR
jgi:hypothetical protein